MKFFCEYCGCRINSEVDDKCPNCGASYRKNENFVKYEEKKKERQEKLEQDTEDIRNFVVGQFKTARKVSKIVTPIIFIIFFVVFAIIIFTFFKIGAR